MFSYLEARAINVTVEVTGGELYDYARHDYVTTNLPYELWQSILGPKSVVKHFWVTTSASFGSKIGDSGLRAEADIKFDYKENILDVVGVALDYGWHY